MKPKHFIFVLILFGAFVGSLPAFSYILPARYVLQYMIAKRGDFQVLQIKQDLDLFDRDFPNGRFTGKEMLYLKRPWAFRIDGNYQGMKQLWVNEGSDYVIVTDGQRTSEGKVSQCLLKEIFTTDNPVDLLSRLQKIGINTSVVSLGRQGNEVFYIIGAEEADKEKPQLWVSEKTLLPKKLFFEEKDHGGAHQAEIRFEDYDGKNGPSWYPSLTEVYWDKTLRAAFKVEKASPLSKVSEQLFNLSEIRKKYPAAADRKDTTLSATTRVSEMLALLKRKH